MKQLLSLFIFVLLNSLMGSLEHLLQERLEPFPGNDSDTLSSGGALIPLDPPLEKGETIIHSPLIPPLEKGARGIYLMANKTL
jgi:hypothetical protein